MKSLLLAVSVLVGGGYAALQAGPTSEAQAARSVKNPGAIASISLATADGADIPMAVLRQALVSKRGERVNAQKLESDREAMLGELTARGYLAAKVSAADVTFADGAAFITYDIVLGVRYRIRTVTVTGATEKDAVITIAAGDDAIPARIESARTTLSDNLARHGKPHDVSVSTAVDHANLVVDVSLAAR